MLNQRAMGLENDGLHLPSPWYRFDGENIGDRGDSGDSILKLK